MFTFGAYDSFTPSMIVYPNKRRTLKIARGLSSVQTFLKTYFYVKRQLYLSLWNQNMNPSYQFMKESMLRVTSYPILLLVLLSI